MCHCPNYNFKGAAYYESTNHPKEEEKILADIKTNGGDITKRIFPSQQVATYHTRIAIEKVKELKKMNESLSEESEESSHMISELESQILFAIQILTSHPGIDHKEAESIVGRPYSDAMRKVYERFHGNAEVCYLYAESLMVLNAWKLYDYPTGKPLSEDVEEIETLLENALQLHPKHAGLCHMYVHLCEMSSTPEKALPVACQTLRTEFSGHLLHMPTHIDVLMGDYLSCVQYNLSAIVADQKVMRISPDTSGVSSFYFGYIVHDYHMLVYGCILGGFEKLAMEKARELNTYLTEDIFVNNPDLAVYLESYSALDIHILVRFGRWEEILQLPFPQNHTLMLYRSSSLHYARGLAFANTGNVKAAITEANQFDELGLHESAEQRILHNNNIAQLLAVDSPMLHGEVAYKNGKYDESFALLKQAVELSDGLQYDEPWGKMQPVRHALGGLLNEQGHHKEAELVFRQDLKFHPRNPWALVGLIECLNNRLGAQSSCCKEKKDETINMSTKERKDIEAELKDLDIQLTEQRQSQWADFNIVTSCACCSPKGSR